MTSVANNPRLSLLDKPFEICIFSVGEFTMKGLFATRNISKGELIIAEKPLFICRGEFSAAFNKLAPADKELFMSYTDVYANSDATKTVDGIGRTNSLPLGDRSDSAGFFPICSLFNHSCRPNVVHRFHTKQFVEKFHAVTDIAEGEQLCTAYTDVHRDLRDRLQLFRSRFNFICACDFCTFLQKNTPAQSESDENRSLLWVLDQNFPNLIYKADKAVELTEHRIKLMETEGLDYLKSSAYYDAFQICIAYQRLLGRAKEYIKKAFDVAVLHYGADSDLAEKYQKFFMNPRSHQNFGLLG
ncbi:hypothetical protein RCL1_006775 [Eukaryota sp. TZLM3-RCL]